MTRACRFALSIALAATCGTLLPFASSSAQTANNDAAFDVASVKRFVPADDRRLAGLISVMPGGRFTAQASTLRELIAVAYDIEDVQIADDRRLLPANRFAIEATTKPDVSAPEARAMLRSLLAERFRLAVHTETRELPVYVLTTARQDRRLGEQLRPSPAGCAPVKPPSGVPAPPEPPPPPITAGRPLMLNLTPLRCRSLMFGNASGGHWSLRGATMPWLAGHLTSTFERPVIDRTSLEGPYDLDITYAIDPQASPTSGDRLGDASALTTALREQLGLRLESARAPVEVLVIDRVEPPTEN